MRLDLNPLTRWRRNGPLVVAIVIVALLGVGLSIAQAAYPRPGDTERVSVSSTGVQGDLPSITTTYGGSNVFSADGRYVAFSSVAADLVVGDTNSTRDIFVHDRVTRTTERVSVASDGTEGSGLSLDPAISADGRFVAFFSYAQNLVPGDPHCCSEDVFVHDRETRTTELVSVAMDGTPGTPGTGSSVSPAISHDGRYVSFYSWANNLVPDDTNGVYDIFVRDRTDGITERVSVGIGGSQANNSSFANSISGDGRFVAFQSLATNLVSGDQNQASDVFVHDRETGTTDRVSVGPDGVEGAIFGQNYGPVISADGAHVAFFSLAPNLVPSDMNGVFDVFVHHRETGTTERASVASDGQEGNANSFVGGISADGREVAIWSVASNLVPDDTNQSRDVFVRDLLAGTTERVSMGGGGQEANNDSDYAAISADGQFLGYYSAASNLVPGDTNGRLDVFVRDRGPAIGVGGLSAAPDGSRMSVSGWATFSGEIMASAVDPVGDATGTGTAGADMTDASIVYRPEVEDLLVRLRLESLPSASAVCPAGCTTMSTGGGNPSILYGFGFELDGARYEIRALRAAASGIPPSVPYFALYQCDQLCTEHARLSGGIGTTGAEVVVSLPLSLLGAQEGAAVSEMRAFTAVGEAAPGRVLTLDEFALPDAAIPLRDVSLGVAPVDTPADQVIFNTPAILQDGTFAGAVTIPPLGARNRHVWARACLGDACSAERVVVEVEDPTSTPTPTPTPSATPTQPSGARGTYPVTPNDPLFGSPSSGPLNLFLAQQWAPKKILAPEAWQQERATGHRIRVAVLDTGVDLDHEDLQCLGKLDVASGTDVVSNDSNPDDENGHGTHVAGIIGACTNNGTGVAGVAPDTTIVPVRVLNASGEGTDAQLIAGLERASELGVHVINMSLAYPVGKETINDVSAINDAIESAADAGTVVVAAAGNQTLPLCAYPSLSEDIVCVGATDPRDLKTWYSHFAFKPTGPAMVAPGGTGQVFCNTHAEEILSLYPTERDLCNDGLDGYRDLNGTSMAAPHVAGVAALVYDRLGGVRSAANAQSVIDALIASADDLGAPGYDPAFGYGRVNALGAVLAATPDPDPTPTMDPSESPTDDPSESPTDDPSESPTDDPSESPTDDPSESPTDDPSESPTDDPSESPTDDPSESPTDDPTTGPGPTVPEAPSNLTARAASSSRIELAWTDNSTTESGFAIERSSDGNDWQEIATAGRNATMHLDLGLDPDTTYSYRVRALNPSGYSPYSNSAAATTMSQQSQAAGGNHAPAAPSNLRASPASPSRIELSWTDNSNNEDGFALERSSDGTTWQEITSTARNQTTYLDAGLAADTTYHYRVRAYNSSGHSAYSAVTSATTKEAPSSGGGAPSPGPTQSSLPVNPATVGTATTSIAASRAKTSFNNGLELSGVVERDDNCTGPLEVEVSRRSHGTDSYESVASTAVNGAGAWGLQVVGRRNASYIAQVKDTDTCQGDPSAPTDVLVRVKITAKAPRSCDGGEVVRGKVRPNHKGTRVILQKRKGKGWRKIDSDVLNAKSRFVLKTRRCGLHRIVWRAQNDANEWGATKLRI